MAGHTFASMVTWTNWALSCRRVAIDPVGFKNILGDIHFWEEKILTDGILSLNIHRTESGILNT